MLKRLVLIDSHAIIHRAYHALPPLTSPSGEPTNAVYGFTTILLRILRELKPDYIAAAFDLPGPTFRQVAYERYKAQRPETPSDLSLQFPGVREVLGAFGIPVFEKEGFEADDIIGTIAKKLFSKKDLEVVVVTGDMDALQLVRPRLKVFSMKKGISETVIYDEKAVRERYGFKPSQLVDFKGLKGDPSDNIPGVKGIGEKTATELIKKFGSIEGIYKVVKTRGHKISESVAAKLREGEEGARLSKDLATINQDVPVKVELKDLQIKKTQNEEGVRSVFQKFGFFSLLKRLNEEEGKRAASQGALPVTASNSKTKVEELDRPETLQPLFAGNNPLHLPVGPHAKDSGAGAGYFGRWGDKSVGLILFGGALHMIISGNPSLVFKFTPKFFERREAKEFFGKGDFFVFDGKSILHFLRDRGMELGRIKFDLMLASYLAGTLLRDFSYLAIASRELGRMVSGDPREEFIRFFEIVKALEVKLETGRLRKVFEEIELPLIPVLARVEERGIKVDKYFLKSLAGEINGELKLLTEKVYELAGGEFNINSPQQLSHILFERLKVKTQGLRKTPKGGVISTGAAELEKLRSAHPIAQKILEYRELSKLKSTYIDALPSVVNPETGRIHTTFNQTGTATGRLSSLEPNLQNIPVMSELGREVRKAFVAEDGFLLVSFDYSQIELRVAAHIANDEKMIEAFQKGLDIHKITAAEIFNTPLEKVTPVERRAAKTLNFGILYGMGSQALAEATGMSKDEAKNFIDEYFRDFSGIRDYIERTKRFAEDNGYVESIFGRRRYIPEIHSPNWQLKREAERMAINMPIQSSATGDIIKIAMIKVDEWIRKERLEEDVRLLLQVHDELLFEIEKELVKKITPQIKEVMERAAELKVPLVVDVKSGGNWGEMGSINQAA